MKWINNKKKPFVTLYELRCWYSIDCLYKSQLDSAMFGKVSETKPTLTGWIKYWRRWCQNSEVPIIYPNRKKESHEIPF